MKGGGVGGVGGRRGRHRERTAQIQEASPGSELMRHSLKDEPAAASWSTDTREMSRKTPRHVGIRRSRSFLPSPAAGL